MVGSDDTRHFKRRRPPSRQATRLMLISVAASLGLGVTLGVLFLPLLLQYEQQPKDPYYQLAAFSSGSQLRIEIVGASYPQQVGVFRVFLRVGTVPNSQEHVFGPLPEGIDGLVGFFDANDDGILNVSDYFLIEMEENTEYLLLILHPNPEVEGGVGYYSWPP